jgi:molybdopterin-guanine dinucleotide biosynthesis protein MobB
MKIIQIIGNSNSGKTTFIRSLIPELKKKGSVAVIKHLGDHNYTVEEGKDTTIFFNSGANISVGIDSDKTVIMIHQNTLDDALGTLFDLGMDFVIIEGFKKQSFPKIVIGDLPSESCIHSNPLIEEVIQSLNLFKTFHK